MRAAGHEAKCSCDESERLETQGPGCDGPCYCDNCDGALEPWPGIPGFDYGDRECEVCGGAIAHHRRSDAIYCSSSCRAERSRLRRLTEGEVVDGYSDLERYESRRKRGVADAA